MFPEGNMIGWKSRRQTIATTSAAESELVEAVDFHQQARNVVLFEIEPEGENAHLVLRQRRRT